MSIPVGAEDYIPVSNELEVTPSETSSEATTDETAPADTPLDEIEYKTIEPPEDGWTLEQFNEVLYINGRNVKIPFCLNDLGDNVLFGEVKYFTGSNPNVDKETNEAFQNIASTLIYLDEISEENVFGIILAEKNQNGEFDRNCIIRDFSILNSDAESICINGWNFTDSSYDLENALGDSYNSRSKTVWVCELHNSDYKINVKLWDKDVVASIKIGNFEK